jgi:hypothetical protein
MQAKQISDETEHLKTEICAMATEQGLHQIMEVTILASLFN